MGYYRKKTKKKYIIRRFALLIICLSIIYGIYYVLKTNINWQTIIELKAPATQIKPEDKYDYVELDKIKIHQGELILVNKNSPYVFPENKELISVYENKSSSYEVNYSTTLLSKTTIDNFNLMMDKFYETTKINDVLLISGYRSYEDQQGLMQKRVDKEGAVEAVKWVATPGASEHHVGLAFDLGIFKNKKSYDFSGEKKYSWISENCSKYGFIIRYPEDKSQITGISYEPWHFRYVGKIHASTMLKNNMCLEEYIDYLKQFTIDGQRLIVTLEEKNYEVYYVKAEEGITKVPIIKGKEYNISGNNTDGFIVIIKE